MSLLVAITGLGLLIVLHEAGHFIVARLCGMRVERFSIGFGPALLAFKRGGTTFQIAPIPLEASSRSQVSTRRSISTGLIPSSIRTGRAGCVFSR